MLGLLWALQGAFSVGKGYEDMRDSDSIIPPSGSGGKPPHATVPYTSLVRSPRSSRSGSFRSPSGQLSRGPQAGPGSSGQLSGQVAGGPQALGDSEEAADDSGLMARMSLPHIMQRDWELNLDALEVCAGPAPCVDTAATCAGLGLPF